MQANEYMNIKLESQVVLSLKMETFLGFEGVALGLKNWIRITIGVEAQMLEDALKRLNRLLQTLYEENISFSSSSEAQ